MYFHPFQDILYPNIDILFQHNTMKIITIFFLRDVRIIECTLNILTQIKIREQSFWILNIPCYVWAGSFTCFITEIMQITLTQISMHRHEEMLMKMLSELLKNVHKNSLRRKLRR